MYRILPTSSCPSPVNFLGERKEGGSELLICHEGTEEPERLRCVCLRVTQYYSTKKEGITKTTILNACLEDWDFLSGPLPLRPSAATIRTVKKWSKSLSCATCQNLKKILKLSILIFQQHSSLLTVHSFNFSYLSVVIFILFQSLGTFLFQFSFKATFSFNYVVIIIPKSPFPVPILQNLHSNAS